MITQQNMQSAAEMWAYINAFRGFGAAMQKTGMFQFGVKAGKGTMVSGMTRVPLPAESSARFQQQIVAMLEAEESRLMEKFRQLIAEQPSATGTGATP